MSTIGREIFEVEIVLLRTLWVKRNVGRGTPTKYLSAYWIIMEFSYHQSEMAGGFFRNRRFAMKIDKLLFTILRYLYESSDVATPSMEPISPQALKIPLEQWNNAIAMLYEDGLIRGIIIKIL